MDPFRMFMLSNVKGSIPVTYTDITDSTTIGQNTTIVTTPTSAVTTSKFF